MYLSWLHCQNSCLWLVLDWTDFNILASLEISGLRADSVNKDTYCQAWSTEFNPHIMHMAQREKQLFKLSSDLQVPRALCTNPHIHSQKKYVLSIIVHVPRLSSFTISASHLPSQCLILLSGKLELISSRVL